MNHVEFGIKLQYDGKEVDAGVSVSREQFNKLGVEANKAGRGATTDLNRMEMSAKATAAALRGVPAQFTDIITALQGGQAPLTVLMQQGGQLKDMFGGVGGAARALGGYVAGLVTPYTVAAAAVAGLGIVLYQGAKESRELTNALILTGSTADYSASRLYKIADGVAAATGATKGAAIEAMTQVITAGKVTEGSIGKVSEASLAMAKATGQDVGDVVQQFAALGKAPVEASLKLNEQYNYLTASVYAQISALKEQGKESEAVTLAQKTFADATLSMAGQVTANLGWIQKGWYGVKSSVLEAIDAAKGWGREDTWQQQLDAVDKALRNRKSVGGSASTAWFNTAELEKEKRVLDAIIAGEQDVTREIAAQNKARKEGLTAEEIAKNLRARYLSNEKKLSLEIEEINRSSLSTDEKRNAIALATERLTKKAQVNAGAEYAAAIAFSERMSTISKELDAEFDAIEQANKSYAKAISDMLDPLAKEASALETEARNYGLTRAEIDATAVSRLDEAIALATLNGASEEALSFLQRELELRQRIAAASAEIAAKKAAETSAKEQEKAFVDAEKAIADERKKGWEETDRIARDVFTSIADDGGSAMEKIGKTLEKALLSAAYEATLQPLVFQAYTSFAGALGGNTGTTGAGGVAGATSSFGSLLSAGNSVYSAATGGIAGGFLSGMASVGSEAALGAAFVGPSATLAGGSVGAGASVGSLFGSAASGLATAIPVVGAALAIGSLLGGLFESGERFDRTTASQTSLYKDGVYKDTGEADYNFAEEPDFGSSVDKALARLNKQFSSSISTLIESLGEDVDIETDARLRLRRTSGALATKFMASINGIDISQAAQYGKDGEDLSGSIEQFFKDVMSKGVVKAINATRIDDAIKGLFANLESVDNTSAMLTNVVNLATYSDELNDVWGISITQAAEVATLMSESTDALIANVAAIAQFSAAQRSAGETLSLTHTDLLSAFDALSDADFPRTLADYDAAMKAVDTTVEGSIETFAELFALRASFAQYQAAIDSIRVATNSAVYDLRTDADKLRLRNADLASIAAAAGVSIPQSAADLVALADAIDYTSESGINLALALPNLVAAFNAVEEASAAAGAEAKAAAKAEAAASVLERAFAFISASADSAFSALSRSVDAEKKRLDTAYASQAEALKSAAESAGTVRDNIASLADSLTRAVGNVTVDTVEFELQRRVGAQQSLEAALSAAQSGQSLVPYSEQINAAITALAKPSENLYETFVDYARAQGRAAGTLSQLDTQAKAQKSVADLTLDALNASIVAADAQHAQDIAALDQTLEVAQLQLDALNGIDTSVMSMAEAIAALSSAIAGSDAMNRASKNPDTLASVAGQRALVSSNGALLYGDHVATPTGYVGSIADANTIISRVFESASPAAFQAAALAVGLSAAMIDAMYEFPPGTANLWAKSKGLPAFAGGGVASAGMYIAGELGPELITADAATRIYPAEQTSALMERLTSPASSSAELVREIRELRKVVEKQAEQLASIRANTGQTAEILDSNTGGGGPSLVRMV